MSIECPKAVQKHPMCRRDRNPADLHRNDERGREKEPARRRLAAGGEKSGAGRPWPRPPAGVTRGTTGRGRERGEAAVVATDTGAGRAGAGEPAAGRESWNLVYGSSPSKCVAWMLGS